MSRAFPSGNSKPLGLLRKLSSVAAVAVAPWLVVACLTPDFKFGERPDGNSGSGGSSMGGGGNTSDHCKNRKIDSDETDTDCGGLDCAPCGLGRKCEADSDCENKSCTANKCQAPSCTDNVKNETETDVDCGGMGCSPCADSKKCVAPTDCESGVCGAGVCKPATCTDRVKNQGEADIDCAGPCEGCDTGASCVIAADCLAPPMGDPSTATCNSSGKCELLCGAGTEDCNTKANDGCEVSTNTDVNNCGGCGNKCAPANAVAGTCVGGQCEIDFTSGGCKPNFADCNGDPSDGCEVNLTSNVNHCGACNAACSSANGTATCAASTCSIVCTGTFKNCDGKARENGCEVDSATDSKNCNTCNNVCPASSGESAYCASSTCGTTVCPVGTGDCDGNTTCTDQLNTITNCGSCGNTCTVANGTPSCSGGTTCAVAACAQYYGNCNGVYADGCETNTQSAVNHCGGCAGSGGTDCNTLKNNVALHIAAISCFAGGCKISGCETDYADCDGSAANGCEVNVKTNDSRCGGCLAGDNNPATGVNCTSLYPNGVGNCNAGTCELAGCSSTHASCDGIDGNGCEVNITNDSANCGGCNVACQTNSVTTSTSCVAKACVPVCGANGQNCDANAVNGCEDKSSDENHCGTCNTVCAVDSVTASNTCTGGTCVPMCTGAGLSCDANGPNGCEDTSVDNSNCGACGVTCSTSAGAHVTSNTCTGSSCNAICSTNYQSCDSNTANGCESDKRTDANNCGNCGVKCGGTAQTNVSGSPTCSASTCSVACAGSFCPNTSDPERKCTLSLGTTSNCASCGNVCNGGTPFCVFGGSTYSCQSTLPIALKQRANFTINQGSASSGSSSTIAISNAAVGHRALVITVATYGNGGFNVPSSVRYGSTTLTALNSRLQGNAYSALYLLKECELVAAGNATVTVQMPAGAGYGGVATDVMLFENVEQTTYTAVTVGLGNATAVSIDSQTLTASGFYVGVAGNQSNAFTVTSPASPTAATFTGTVGPLASMSSVWGPMTAGSYQFAWTSNWGEKTATGVALRAAVTAAGTCP